MPEQQSKRGNSITASNFEAPFQTQVVRYGVKGLNLRDSLDALEGWSRHTNLDHDNTGQATTRPGQTAFATGGTTHHSIRRFLDPFGGDETRLWGIDTGLYRGDSGTLSSIDSGYSGDPLAIVPHRPPLSGDPWAFIADRSRMRKVRFDGLVVPIGLPAPTQPAAPALGPEHRTSIAIFRAADGTDAASWTAVAGEDANGNASGPPTILDDNSSPLTGGGLQLTTVPGATTGPYNSWGGVPMTRALNFVDTIAATDDDIIHLLMKTSHPYLIQEIRIYLVVSSIFDPTILPGSGSLGVGGAGGNEDAYVKSFRQNDFVQFIQATQTQIDAAETARVFALRDEDLQNRATGDTRPSAAQPISVTDPVRDISKQIGAGAQEWFELGIVGVPLRRGDFKRIGSSVGRDWGTVTGFILYVSHDVNPTNLAVEVAIDDLYLTGGAGPDTMEVGAQPYDYRYTNYDPRTGAESNGSPAMDDPIDNGIDALRRQICITPAAYGDGAIVQRFYRRGGSIVNDWFFLGDNGADGAIFADILTDDAIAAAGDIPIDNFQPVPTVDDSGNTILAQAVPALWGPLNGILFACGDPYRPGHLYFSVADSPDHWAAEGNTEVCPPSEQLMNGGLMGGQAFVFSRRNLYAIYPDLSGDGGVTAVPTLCKRGLAGRWFFTTGPQGFYFGSEDGIFVTTGGPEQWLSKDIDPLFKGQTVNGYAPINLAAETRLRLTIWDNNLYFSYLDTNNRAQVLVYSFLLQFWRAYSFGQAQATLQGEDEDTLLIGGLSSGTTYLLSGATDAGTAIPWDVRTGAISGGTREEKLFGDQFVDCDPGGGAVTAQTFINEEAVANGTQALSGSGRTRFILDGFGEGPQKAHSLSVDLSGTGAATLYQTGVAITLQPDITNRRVTNWDDLQSPDEVWLTGVTFDCDTGGADKTVLIEIDFAETKTVIATLTVNCNGRHKQTFSWPAVSARMVRVHPESEACQSWLLYRVDWIWQVEPPRISQWDIHFENQYDQYYTGLDLYCDTFGATKQIEVFVDEVQLANTLGGGLTYWPVTTIGRNVVHLTLPWGRGHVFRFKAVDSNPGLLYHHRWQIQPEPSEQANWNQNFSILGTGADKFLKAVVVECDTFGQNKQVTVEIDGAVIETLTVNASGRKAVQVALSQQRLGRVFRFFPVDGNPGRLYSLQPIFDEEPFQLNRWETQETPHGIPGWFSLLYGHVTLKSTAPVSLTVTQQVNQPRPGSIIRTVTTTYPLPSTGGVKAKLFVTFQANKGVLVKYLLTSAAPFYLYREETTITVQPWSAAQALEVQPFGDDDEDPPRPMINAAVAAERSG